MSKTHFLILYKSFYTNVALSIKPWRNKFLSFVKLERLFCSSNGERGYKKPLARGYPKCKTQNGQFKSS